MLYYQEITLLEQHEIPLHFLWSKLYTQLHLAFVEQKDEQEKIIYGVSFPQYRLVQQKKLGFLGDKLRIFAQSVEQLQQLNLAFWLERLTDYVHLTSPREVPKEKIKGYAHYFKVNPKLSLEQRIIHQANRRGISVEDATQHFKELELSETFEPYINMKSQSNHINFRLIIGKDLVDEASAGKFGTYGLSRKATVPEF